MRNLEQIIASLRRHRPRNVEGLLNDCKLTLTFVSDGAYRNVYEISEAPCVVKIPKYPDSDGYAHATKEYRAWCQIMRSECYAHLLPLMPTIHYHNRKTGITLMRSYDTGFNRTKYRKQIRAAEDVLEKAFRSTDLHNGNFGVDETGALKVIDMGMFSRDKAKRRRKR